jgi:hypothetical protein
MNLGENRIGKRILRLARSPAVPRFPHSQAIPDRVHNSLLDTRPRLTATGGESPQNQSSRPWWVFIGYSLGGYKLRKGRRPASCILMGRSQGRRPLNT